MNALDEACLRLFAEGINNPIKVLAAMTVLMTDGVPADKAAELMYTVDQKSDDDPILQAVHIVKLRKAVREE